MGTPFHEQACHIRLGLRLAELEESPLHAVAHSIVSLDPLWRLAVNPPHRGSLSSHPREWRPFRPDNRMDPIMCQCAPQSLTPWSSVSKFYS